jgi:hypothetical protein
MATTNNPHFFLQLSLNTKHYDTVHTGKVYPGVIYITIEYMEKLRTYFIAGTVDAALNYSEKYLRALLLSNPEKEFYLDWLLRFCPIRYNGGQYAENEKEKFIKKHGVNIEAAITDFKSCQPGHEDMIVNGTRGVFPVDIYYPYGGVTVWNAGRTISGTRLRIIGLKPVAKN